MKSLFSEYKNTIIKTILICSIVVVALSLTYGLISGSISSFFQKFWKILSPVTIGFVIAYLSNPIVIFFEKRIFKGISKFNVRRLISIIVTFLLIFSFLVFIITMLVPSIATTLQSFWDSYIVNYKNTISVLSERINTFMDNFALFNTTQRLDPEAIIVWIQDKLPWIEDVISGDLSGLIPDDSGNESNFDISSIFSSENIISLLGDVFSIGTSIFTAIKDSFLGIFIAVYMLMSKEKCKAYFRRLLNSIMKPRHVRSVIRFTKLLDNSFGGFIEGQLLDAIVVGILSYIVFILFKMPMPHLLATIIAVTNVIPILGPFLGGIPAAVLVLLSSPGKLILFIVLIIVIQQIDGNIICPHILGDRINVSSLVTIIAIVTMGGLFGIFGMLIGVPIFAVVIQMINNYTLNALRRKGYETSLKHYYVGNPDGIIDNKKHSKSIKISLSTITELIYNIRKLFTKKEQNKEK